MDIGWWSCSQVLAALPGRASYPPWPFSETQLAACPPHRVLVRTRGRRGWVRGLGHVNPCVSRLPRRMVSTNRCCTEGVMSRPWSMPVLLTAQGALSVVTLCVVVWSHPGVSLASISAPCELGDNLAHWGPLLAPAPAEGMSPQIRQADWSRGCTGVQGLHESPRLSRGFETRTVGFCPALGMSPGLGLCGRPGIFLVQSWVPRK